MRPMVIRMLSMYATYVCMHIHAIIYVYKKLQSKTFICSEDRSGQWQIKEILQHDKITGISWEIQRILTQQLHLSFSCIRYTMWGFHFMTWQRGLRYTPSFLQYAIYHLKNLHKHTHSSCQVKALSTKYS